MTHLTLFEHETIPFDWEMQHLVAIEQLRVRQGTSMLEASTRRGQRVLKAGAYVGMVRLGNLTCQLLPKLDAGEDKSGSATRNLLYLLALASNLPVKQQGLTGLLARGHDWFELLTTLFAQELVRLCTQGAHHHYQMVEETAVSLKGKWRLTAQLRQPARQHRFEVGYDEYSIDNQLNRVLRFVVELLWQKTANSHNRRLLGELRHLLGGVTLLPMVTAEQAIPTQLNRLNRQYEPLLNLAHLFLKNQPLELNAGPTQSFALLFNMNQLFESLIVRLIQAHRKIILPTELQTCALLPQGGQQRRWLAQTEAGKEAFRLDPDLLVALGERFPLLLDMKYKRLQIKGAKPKIGQGDFYQMFAYGRRYGCDQVLLIYPQTERPQRHCFSLPGEKFVIRIATVDLNRPLWKESGRFALVRELQSIVREEVNNVSTL